jgi:hypothetical protein
MSGVRCHKSQNLTLEERFWVKVDTSGGADACWPWLGSQDQRGYGMFSRPRGSTKMVRANRQALEFHLGRELLPDEEARHSCDNPPCCNPAHLLPGTHCDNMGDYAGSNHAKGHRHSRAKLAEADFHKALKLRDDGMLVKDIANEIGISRSHMSRVLRGLTGHSEVSLTSSKPSAILSARYVDVPHRNRKNHRTEMRGLVVALRRTFLCVRALHITVDHQDPFIGRHISTSI